MSEKDLETRKREAEERLAAAEAKRAARRPAEALVEIERLEREAAELEAIEEAEAEHGELDKDIKVVRSPRGIVIVRRPPYVVVKRFHDVGKTSVEAKDKLGRPCVVHPTADAYAKMAADDVALVCAVADAAAWLAGFGRTSIDEKSSV